MTNSFREGIQTFWNTLNLETLDSLKEFYSTDVEYEDPLSKGKGIGELKKHFEKIYRTLKFVQYEYARSISSSNRLVIEWTMKAYFRGSKRSFELSGITFLEIDTLSGLITNSKEYFDLGQALYQHIPLLGTAIKVIKSQAAST